MDFSHPSRLSIADFTYDLPAERIAYYPLADRDASKLLVFREGLSINTKFKNLPDHLPDHSLLIFNDTRVINARIIFQKSTGGKIEIFCLEPLIINTSLQQKGISEWNCMVGGAGKWKNDELVKEIETGKSKILLRAKLLDREGNSFKIRFTWKPEELLFEEVLESAGQIPLPPYIKRNAEESDAERYQTVYAKQSGSVAAPTAGLHFTESVMKELEKKHIEKGFVTLHVSAGTFKPVDANQMDGHVMHAEWISVKAEMIKRLAEFAGPVAAVGTTSARTLETLYWLGVKAMLHPDIEKLALSQWDVYEDDMREIRISKKEALLALESWLIKTGQEQLFSSTSLMIAPGYRFRMINALITNFHQPRSTLLLLVAAAAGDDWKKIYRTAMENDFRFLSYGDSSLIFIDQG